jgi:oligopeptide/dipeptide ABC transporter ATP-binding protein
MIAQPELLVADEPTTGLDAALKADLIDLLLSGRGPDRGYLIISHDLAMVRYACDRVVVLHAGAVVEEFPVERLGRVRHHPYTRSLLEAAGLMPRSGTNEGSGSIGRSGQGCSFVGACPLEKAGCRTAPPALSDADVKGHRRACTVLAQEAKS